MFIKKRNAKRVLQSTHGVYKECQQKDRGSNKKQHPSMTMPKDYKEKQASFLDQKALCH